MSTNNSPTNYPLLTLHPIADARERWVAVLLQAEAATADPGALIRLLAEAELFDALGTLPCVMPLMSAGAFLPGLTASLPVERTVLRLPTAECEGSGNEALASLRSAGFQLMAEGLLGQAKLADGIKALAVNCAAEANTGDPEINARLGKALAGLPGPHLALALDDPGQLKLYQGMGFGWIAGNHPLRVATVSPATANPGRAIMLKLLGQIVSDADSKDIETTLKQDPQLSYQLLKLVNSVAFALTTEIGSFGQAITLLGRRQLQRWLQLLLYARPNNEKGQASPLMPRAALRAGLMENLAKLTACSKEVQEQAFMVGMFSLLEPMFGQSSAEVIKPLHLAQDVSSALVARQGRLGLWLAAVEASENGPLPHTHAALAEAGVDSVIWVKAQVAAARWAIQVSREA